MRRVHDFVVLAAIIGIGFTYKYPEPEKLPNKK
jgi:hypothetical protein